MVTSIRNAVAYLIVVAAIVFGLDITVHFIFGGPIRWIADAVFVPVLAVASQVGVRKRRRRRAVPLSADSPSIDGTH
jgi:hypothetical protein